MCMCVCVCVCVCVPRGGGSSDEGRQLEHLFAVRCLARQGFDLCGEAHRLRGQRVDGCVQLGNPICGWGWGWGFSELWCAASLVSVSTLLLSLLTCAVSVCTDASSWMIQSVEGLGFQVQDISL